MCNGLDTQNMMQIHSDIAGNAHHIVADTLLANLQQKLQVQIKNPLYIYGGTVHTYFVAKTCVISVEEMCLCEKTVFAPKSVCIYSSHSFEFSSFYNDNGRSINRPCSSVPCSMGQARYDVQR